MDPRMLRTILMSALVLAPAFLLGADSAWAGSGYHPHTSESAGRVREVDLSAASVRVRRAALRAAERRGAQPTLAWDALDDIAASPPEERRANSDAAGLPDGWVQRGSVVLPGPVARGEVQVDPDVIFAIEDVPGNKYPRKHTLYLNFVGAEMLGGFDNSAENRSALARIGPYPAYLGGNQKALSIAQAVAEDLASYGVQVVYLPEDRPSKTVPYTMQMMGGTWQDTNIDSPAGGVAPGADCGALGQRHVVYTFAAAGMGVNTAANTASQEAGHAWGLDHTLNCGSVMSYCGVANGVFSDTCDPLCESQCQGPNSAGCRITHEMFCGEDSDQQNEAQTLAWLFGGSEPDVEAPTVDIISPLDGTQFETGVDIALRAEVDDDYGGFGWKYVLALNGETVLEEVDYDRNIDDEYRAALNLTNLQEGNWSVTVEVEDHFDHVTSQTVNFVVGDPPPVAEDDTGGTEDGGDTGDSTTDDPGDDTGDSAGEDDDDDKGCACHVGSRGRTAPWGALGLLAIAVRRRGRQISFVSRHDHHHR